MVVDRDVDPVPADPAVAVDLDARDPVTAAGPDPAEHLRIEMDELTGPIAFMAHDGRPRFEPVEPAEAPPAGGSRRRSSGQARLPAEDVRADPELAAASAQPLDEFGRVPAGVVVDRARPIGETTHLGELAGFPRCPATGDRPAGGKRRGPAQRNSFGSLINLMRPRERLATS